MTPSLARQAVGALVAAVGIMIAAAAMAAPRPVAELVLHGLPSHPKWVPEEPPLFGSYLASGDGDASGGIVGHFVWDLYEDQSRRDRHPAWFRGFVERDGRRYPFVIIGIYTPASADRRRWTISGAITFDDGQLLGTSHAPITGTYEANTRSARYIVWADRDSP